MGEEPQTQIIAPAGVPSVATVASVTLRISTRLLLHWSEIAIDEERRAWEGRREVEARVAAEEPRDLPLEMHPSMVAIAAAVHALDALYGEVQPLVGQTQGDTRRRHVHHALELGFNVDRQRWRSQFSRLFGERRDRLVHPPTEFSDPTPHPLGGFNVALEYALFSPEEATAAVDVLLDVLTTCVTQPAPALERWANDARAPVEGLVARRQQPRAAP